MTSPPRRRPLPALVFLVALTLLTALVWWRVLSREDSHATGQACPTPSTRSSAAVLPRPAQVHLTVLNSTTRYHLAGDTAKTLGTYGFKIDGTANDAGNPVIKGVGEIRYLSTAKINAQLLSYYLPGATLQQVVKKDASTPALVLSLGESFKKLATPAAVAAKLKAADLSFAPTTSPAPGATGTATATATASC
jgi:hypothetical protein